MKKIRITYSWHEDPVEFDAKKQTSSFAIEVEDEIFHDCVEQKSPYKCNRTTTFCQSYIAILAFWHAALHNRFVRKDDEILDVQAEPEARFQTFSPD